MSFGRPRKFKRAVPATLFLALLTVTAHLHRFAAASCSADSDYLNLIGSSTTGVKQVYTAPDSLGNLLVAGTYQEYLPLSLMVDDPIILFVYFFKVDSCDFVWKYSGGDQNIYARGAAWSPDDSQAYILAYRAEAATDYEWLTVFKDPYDLRPPYGSAQPVTYQITPQTSLSYSLENTSGLIALNSSSDDQRILIVRDKDASIVRFIHGNAYVYSTQTTDSYQFHAHYQATSDELFFLSATSVEEGHNYRRESTIVKKFQAQSLATAITIAPLAELSWLDNTDYDSLVSGRIAVREDSSTGDQAIFVATSQIYEHSPGSDAVDLIKMTLNSNENHECGPPCSCVRQQFDIWARVLAVAPQSMDSANFILMFDGLASYSEEGGGGGPGGGRRLEYSAELKLVMVSVDFASGTYVTYTQQQFYADSYEFFNSYEEQATLQVLPYYDSTGTFQDFYLSIVMRAIPEALISDELIIDLSMKGFVTRVLDPSRANAYFDTGDGGQSFSDASGLSLAITESDATTIEYKVSRFSAVAHHDDPFMNHLNALTNGNTLIDEHHNIVEMSRHIVLDNAPFRLDNSDLSQEYLIGEYLFSTMPTFYDTEDLDQQDLEQDDGTIALPTPVSVSLVSFSVTSSYFDEDDTFFEVMPQTDSIRSGRFTEDHVGTHVLNITVADPQGSQKSFGLNVLVTSEEATGFSQDEIAVTTTDAELQDAVNGLIAIAEAEESASSETQSEGGGGGPSGDAQASFDAFWEALTDEQRGQILIAFPDYDISNLTEEQIKAMQAYVNGDQEALGFLVRDVISKNGYNFEIEGFDLSSLGFDYKNENEQQVEAVEEEEVQEETATTAVVDALFIFDADRYVSSSGCTTEEECKWSSESKDVAMEASIDSDGLITITFSEPVPVLAELYQNILAHNVRRLQQKYDEYQHQDETSSFSQVVTLEIFLSFFKIEFNDSLFDDGDESTHTFSWEIIEVTERTITIQLTWDHPEAISNDGFTDEMQLVIDTSILGLDYTFIETVEVPAQGSDSIIEKIAVEESGAGSQAAAAAVTGVAAAFRVLMVGALSQVWGLINGLSMFVHLPLVGIVIPDHTLAVLSQLIDIAQFDIVENELVYGSFIPFMEEEDYLLRLPFVTTGYESSYAFVNMGTNVIIITILLLIKAVLVLTLPWRHSSNVTGKYHRKCRDSIFWNFWLRMLLQGCLEISIAALIYIIDRSKLVQLTDDYSLFFFINDLLSYSLLLALIAMPVWIFYFYFKHFDKLDNKEFASTYAAIYDGLHTRSRCIIFFPIYFIVRRLIFVGMGFSMTEYPTFQINGLLLMTIISYIYLVRYKPFKTNLLQRLEEFNEVTSLALLYTTFLFTNYVPDDSVHGVIGWFFNGLMIVNISVHLFFLIRSVVTNCKAKARAKKFKKQANQRVAKDDKAEQSAKEASHEAETSLNKGQLRSKRKRKGILASMMSQIQEADSAQEGSERRQSSRSSQNNYPKIQLRTINNLSVSRPEADEDKAQPYKIREEADSKDIFVTPRSYSEAVSPIRVIQSPKSSQAKQANELMDMLEPPREKGQAGQIKATEEQNFDLDSAYNDFVVNSIQGKSSVGGRSLIKEEEKVDQHESQELNEDEYELV